MKELDNSMIKAEEMDMKEMQQYNGGCGLLCLIIAGIVIAGGTVTMQEWDDFKDGFASAFD